MSTKELYKLNWNHFTFKKELDSEEISKNNCEETMEY